MPSVNECCSLASQAPASPENARGRSTPAVRSHGTERPSAAAAAGCSPVARRRSPNGVRKRSQVASGTSTNVSGTSGVASRGPSAGTRASGPSGRARGAAGGGGGARGGGGGVGGGGEQGREHEAGEPGGEEVKADAAGDLVGAE